MPLVVGADRQLRSLTTRRLRQVAVTLMAAEHVGGARWCLETATEYAKVRVQFGRPIGQFQAVKHRLADMAVRVEQMTAVAWDAAVAVSVPADGPDSVELASATAGALTFDGYVRSSQECLQLLGGIGFTWEHDLHLHFKRAHADRQLIGETDVFRREVAIRGRVRRASRADRRPARRGRVGPARPWPRSWPSWPARRTPRGGPPWSTRAWWCPTGRSPGDGTPVPSSRWSSTSSWPRWGSSGPTSGSVPGPCP